MSKIFLDANVFFYLDDPSSPKHTLTRSLIADLVENRHSLVTSAWVFNEIHYLFLRKIGPELAVKKIVKLLQIVPVEFVNIEIDQRTLFRIFGLCSTYHLKTFDAFHAYYCRKLRIRQILTFDTDFCSVAGLKVISS